VPAEQYDWAEPDSLGRFRLWMSVARFAEAQQVRNTQIQLGIRFLNALEAVNEGGVSETWVSRHGAFTVHFDANDRVAWKSEDGVRIVPPWQHWWQQFRNR
jgi:hypothetical protein